MVFTHSFHFVSFSLSGCWFALFDNDEKKPFKEYGMGPWVAIKAVGKRESTRMASLFHPRKAARRWMLGHLTMKSPPSCSLRRGWKIDDGLGGMGIEAGVFKGFGRSHGDEVASVQVSANKKNPSSGPHHFA